MTTRFFGRSTRTGLWRGIAIASLVAVLGATMAGPAGADPAPSSYQPDSIGTVGSTDCSVFPIDNVWHSLVDQAGTPIDEAETDHLTSNTDVVMQAGFAASYPGTDTLNPKDGHGLNIVDSSAGATPRKFIHSLGDGTPAHSIAPESSDWAFKDSSNPDLPVRYSFFPAPGPGAIKWEDGRYDNSNFDSHLYILDTGRCRTFESIQFSAALKNDGIYDIWHSAEFDLSQNERRANRWNGDYDAASTPPRKGHWYNSSGWTFGCSPNADPAQFPCPPAPLPTVPTPATERAATAVGGSNLSGVGGMIRQEETLPGREIDHAIGLVLPTDLNNEKERSTSYVWPATKTDGTGDVDVNPDDLKSVPMGTRIRLEPAVAQALLDNIDAILYGSGPGQLNLSPSTEICNPGPYRHLCQVKKIIQALKVHGGIVMDSREATDSNGAGGFSLYGEQSSQWHSYLIRAINRVDGLGVNSVAKPVSGGPISLADFQVVDEQDMRYCPIAPTACTAGDFPDTNSDDWLRVR